MPEVVGAVIGAIAVIGIPLAAWLSRRTTREGRLLLRVERLGSAYALMPVSTEKDTFEVYLNAAVRDLNVWLDPDNAKQRKLVRVVSGWIYAFGMLAFFITQPIAQANDNPLLASWNGVLIGSGIALVASVAALLLERRTRKQKAEAVKAIEDAAAAVRMEALRRGEAAQSSA